MEWSLEILNVTSVPSPQIFQSTSEIMSRRFIKEICQGQNNQQAPGTLCQIKISNSNVTNAPFKLWSPQSFVITCLIMLEIFILFDLIKLSIKVVFKLTILLLYLLLNKRTGGASKAGGEDEEECVRYVRHILQKKRTNMTYLHNQTRTKIGYILSTSARQVVICSYV